MNENQIIIVSDPCDEQVGSHITITVNTYDDIMY